MENNNEISKYAAEKQKILKILSATYQGSGSALQFDSVFQLLVAVMLSAQTNDNQVNKITDKLFIDHGTPQAIAIMNEHELESYIRTCGLYKNKTKNIINTARLILEDYHGNVPDTREELMKLPGVGRKTANVVLSVGFGVPAFAVDTHVYRVAHRLGLSDATTPLLVEEDLCNIIPKDDWGNAHHWLIWHGRKICTAIKPKCASCPMKELCPSRQ